MRLTTIISRLEMHLKKAKELENENLSDYFIFNTLAMECFQAVNSAIELGEYIISEKNLGFPSKYKDIFELLHKSGIINRKDLDSIRRLIFLRNLISHEYYTIKEEELKEMVGLLDSFKELIKKSKKMNFVV